MHHLSVLAEVAPADQPGVPPSVVGVVVLALAIGVVWWFYRLSTAKVSDEVVEPRARSRRRRRGRVDDVPLDPLLPPAAGLAPAAPDAATPSVPDSATSAGAPIPDSRTVQERLAALDHALAAGTLGADEHRVLRAALLDD